ncbi:MAG TPA: hypothetical protein VJ959_13635 [Desulfotignum sp.]|nr:hypothetical protein [Desulfotignum sp.]
MHYITAVIRMLRLDPSGVKQLPLHLLPYICILHVAVLGLIYGGTASLLSQGVLAGQGLDPGSFDAVKITIAGIPVAFLMHAGAALFIWVFLKGLGGHAGFLNAYIAMGIAAVSLWPLAPFLVMLQTAAAGPAAAAGSFITAVYALFVHTKVIQDASGLSLMKVIISLSAAIVYIGCFLYLWV